MCGLSCPLYRYNADIRGPRHVHQRVLNDYIDQLLSKGAKAVADALKDLARDSEVSELLHMVRK